MHTAKLIRNGGSQAVRLPKAFSFPQRTKIYIRKRGDEVILSPKSSDWSDLLECLAKFPADLELKRDQSANQERESFYK